MKLKTNYVLEKMVLFFVDKKWPRKKEKGHLAQYYMTRCTTCHNDLPFKMAAKQSRTTTITKCTCKACLVVDHPERALTLEKCIIEGKVIVRFPWTERFFMNYAIFLDIFKLLHVTSTKVTRASLRKCGNKRSVVWKNNKIWKGKAIFLKTYRLNRLKHWWNWKLPPRMYF